jgi:hypothetical protein
MANQGYPPTSYSGNHTPIFPADTPNHNDPYPPGTHFFHTDFLPISPSDSQDPDPTTTAHLLAIEEEKRRRNTAASARFRMKKKEREQALEKTATEMTDKVRELEQKVGQLELENRWLRGLIVERRRKMSNGEEETEDATGASSRKGSLLGGAADGRRKSGKKGSKDVDVERSPRKRNDGVGTN